MDISQIVQVVITRGSKSVTREGFGTPLVLSAEATFTGVRVYTTLKAVSADFASNTQTYKMANALFEQNEGLQTIKIAKATTKIAQVVTVTPTPVNGATYTETINGVDYSFTADETATAAEIVAGLISSIQAGSDATITSSGTNTLIITAAVPGTGFSHSEGANLAAVVTTPNNGIVEDLATASAADSDWYALLLTSRADDDIMDAAASIEAQRKIFIACKDLSVLSVGTTDVYSKLKGKNYARTLPLSSGDQVDCPDGALIGQRLPLKPGSATWKFATLQGITPDILNATQEAQALLKNINIYENVGGVNMLSNGTMADGEFADIIHGTDAFQADVEESVFSLLANAKKIPFTDKGLSIIEAEIRAAGQRWVNNGLFVAGSFDVQMPKVSDISSADRQARLLEGVTFSANYQGAVHKVSMQGTLSV